MKDKEEILASLAAEFDGLYKRYEGKVSDAVIIEKFLAAYPEMKEELRPLLEESVWLRKTSSLSRCRRDKGYHKDCEVSLPNR